MAYLKSVNHYNIPDIIAGGVQVTGLQAGISAGPKDQVPST